VRVGEIQVVLKLAYRGFQSALRGIRGQITSFKNSITSLGRGISRIFSSLFRVIRNVGIVAGIAFGAMIIAGARFEDAMNRTFAIISGGSEMAAAGMSALTEEARRLGRETLYSSTQAAKGMQVLALAGFNTREILKTIGPVLNMAIVGNIELAEASSIAITALRSFQMDASKTVRVSDILAKAAVSANITIGSLGESLKYSAAVANAAGWSIEELTAAIGQMGNAGFQGSMAGSSLRRAISMMLSPTSQAQKIMNKLGLTFTDSTGKLKPFVEIITALEIAGIGAADMFKLFGLRAAPAMTAVVSMGVGSLTKLQKKLEDSAGTADKMSQKFRETIVGRFKDLIATVNELAITFTKAFGTSIADVLFGMRNWLNVVNDAIQANGRLKLIIDAVKAGLSPLTEKFKELGQGIIDGIKDANFDTITEGIEEFVTKASTGMNQFIELIRGINWEGLFKGLVRVLEGIISLMNQIEAVKWGYKYAAEDTVKTAKKPGVMEAATLGAGGKYSPMGMLMDMFKNIIKPRIPSATVPTRENLPPREKEYAPGFGMGMSGIMRERILKLAAEKEEQGKSLEELLGTITITKDQFLEINQKIINELKEMNEAIAANTQQIGNAKVEDKAKNSNYLRNLKIGG